MPKEHRGDRGHDERLEEVSRHARVVTNVVADVIGDHGWVARVVLGDARFDFSDEVSADIGCFGVNAATEPRENADQ